MNQAAMGVRSRLGPDEVARREAQLMAATLELFDERGYADTSMTDVARAVGVTKGTLYYYVHSKHELLDRIVEQVHCGLRRIMIDVGARSDLTALQRIEAYVQQRTLFTLRNRKLVSVYHRDAARSDAGGHITRWRQAQQRFVTHLIEQAVESGEAPADIDVEVMTECVFGVAASYLTWDAPDGPASAAALAAFCGQFVREGVRCGPRPRPAGPDFPAYRLVDTRRR
jgi:AcrR family transcriptional regulator